MRIGLVCEGPTDVPAVKHFIGDQIRRRGLEPEFQNLFPEPDRTRAGAGWSNLLLWLKKNPVDARIARYFSGGLFGGDAARAPLDAIVVQIDADVVDDACFQAYVTANFGLFFTQIETSTQRGKVMADILSAASEMELMTDADKRRHIFAIAVESTETWCLAAFQAKPADLEELRGQDLTNAFMRALEISESRKPQDIYSNCDKNEVRRDKFCVNFSQNSDRIVRSCPHFAQVMAAIDLQGQMQ